MGLETTAPAAPGPQPRLPSDKARKAAARQGLNKQSRRWQGRVLRVRYRWLDASVTPPPAPVLTMAVAKKQARRAVDRNRVKRLVREWFRQSAGIARPADLLVGLSRSWVRHDSEPDLLADLSDLRGVLTGSGQHRPRPPAVALLPAALPSRATPPPPVA